MNVNCKYLKDENGNIISPVVSPDSIITESGRKFRPTLVWANDNPTQPFEPIDITISPAYQYDYLLIHFIRNGSNVYRRFTQFLEKHTSTVLTTCDFQDGSNKVRVWTRIMQDMGNNVIHTDSCYLTVNETSTEVNDNLLIPYLIYAFNY